MIILNVCVLGWYLNSIGGVMVGFGYVYDGGIDVCVFL